MILELKMNDLPGAAGIAGRLIIRKNRLRNRQDKGAAAGYPALFCRR